MRGWTRVARGRAQRTALHALGWLKAILDHYAFDYEHRLPGWANPAVIPRKMRARDEPGSRHLRKAACGLLRFAPSEIEQLTTHHEIPLVRRVFYAVAAYTGLRVSELCSLQWGDLRSMEYCDAIVVVRSASSNKPRAGLKTCDRLDVPIHPILRQILDCWAHRFEDFYGQPRRSDTLLVPRVERGTGRLARRYGEAVRSQLARDCRRARVRSGITIHRFRDTMISTAEDCGARPDLIEKITHPKGSKRRRGAFSGYSRPVWKTLADEISLIDYGHRLPWW